MKMGGMRFRFLIAGAAILALLLPSFSEAASLSELLKKQSDLQQKAEQSKRAIEQKKREASDLKGAIGNLDGDILDTEEEIRTTESQIETTNNVIAALSADIGKTQGELDGMGGKLKSAYVSLYEMSQTSTLELILQSDSLNDMLSQAQYVQSIQTDLQRNITTANSLKSDLEKKKSDTESQKARLVSLNDSLSRAKRSLNSQRSQKNSLLTQTNGQQVEYEVLLKKLEAQKEVVSKQIYDLRRSLGGSFADGGTGGYPYANASPSGVDPWYYYYRQCTSYAAWKFLAYYGVPFMNTRPGSGSAFNWPALAGDQGYRTGSTPQANVLVSWTKSQSSPIFGHVAWVTKTYPNGNIDVAEYNFRVPLGYGERYNFDPRDSRLGTPTYIYP